MKLSIAECTAIMIALNRSSFDLRAGWGRDKEGEPLLEQEVEKRVSINRSAYLKVKARLEDLKKNDRDPLHTEFSVPRENEN